jgi:hypothetical protein
MESFDPVLFGGDIQCISAITGCANPTTELLDEAQATFGNDTLVATILTIGAGKIDRAGKATAYINDKHIEMARNAVANTEATHQNLQRRLNSLGMYFRFDVEFGSSSQTNPRAIKGFTSKYIEGGSVDSELNAVLSKMLSRKGVKTLKEISEL